jgi:hypothetical protein
MAKVDVHLKALEDCGHVANILYKEFKDIADGYPAKGADATIFGRLDGAGKLAGLLDTVEGDLAEEFGKAQSNLKGVEHALDLVRDNVRGANKASGA